MSPSSSGRGFSGLPAQHVSILSVCRPAYVERGKARAFADSYDDMNFTAADLSKITACTLLVQGDHDPFYPIEISREMAKSIPRSSLWVVPNGSHVPIGGRLPEFLERTLTFLRQ